MTFTPDYSRQQRLPGFGEQGQEKLRKASVLIIGAGGLGCAVIPVLAGAGVGCLEILDYDVVDTSNLHRQTIYRADQVGKSKAVLAAAYARALNPSIDVSAQTEKLNASDLLNKIAEVDLVLECTDDFSHKLQVNAAAVLLGKPVVFANAVKMEGQLQVFSGDRKTPCLRCLWQQLPSSTMTCDAHGVLGSVPALMGNLQANEALQMLMGIGESLGQRVLYYEAAGYRQRLIRLHLSENCPLHDTSYNQEAFLEEYAELEFSGTLEDAIEEGMVVIDMRDENVRSVSPIGVRHQAFSTAELVAEIKGEPLVSILENEKVLLVCYKGRTSLSVTSALRSQGYTRIYSKKSGLG